MFWLIIIIIMVLVLVFIVPHIKFVRISSICIVTGAVKTGKTTLAVHLALKQYSKQLRKYRIKKYLLFKKNTEKPLLYSNIPLKTRHTVYKCTRELLLRIERFAYGSVVLMSEASLVADSQNYKDQWQNDCLTCFNKLFGHETQGGYLIYDTQNIADVHYSIRRACSSYLWIHHNTKVPFMLLLDVRELLYDDTNSVVNSMSGDLDHEVNKWIFVPKKVWKVFDSYCYSILTDSLPVSKVPYNTDSLKAETILQLREFVNLKKEVKK